MAYISFEPNDHFNTKLYTGNGGTNAQTGIGFLPSWTWIKNRSDTHAHVLVDAVRGVTKELRSNGNNAEITTSNSFTSFDSDGFTLGADSTDSYNKNSNNYVSWNWKANGAGSANTDGSINTTATSANTTSGFSISKYTGTGSNATVGHGLGAVPKVVLVKGIGHTSQWYMYHIGTDANGVMLLDGTAAKTTDTVSWQNTTPTSSVFSIGNDGGTNGSGNTYIAYCFAEKTGFSKFGSYTGNGNADGPFVYTGFKPSYINLKRTDNTGHWIMKDWQTPGYNQNDYYLWSDTTDAETSASSLGIDFLSNGFKLRGTAGNSNGSGGTFIYMAFAEEPLVASNGTPATAR